MQIAGLNKTTLLDYPEHVAATIFTTGCNFHCHFCHNPDLVVGKINKHELINEYEIFEFLKKRKNVLTGVCISGGEPTIQADLEDFIRKIMELGYLVKLDTNGYKPEVLKNLLNENLLDYIAMDIKNTKEKYNLTIGFENLAHNHVPHKKFSLENIEKSIELIKQSGITHEFRTTVVKELHTEIDLIEIGNWINGSNWYMQSFEDNGNVLVPGYTPYSNAEFIMIYENLIEQGITVKIRTA